MPPLVAYLLIACWLRHDAGFIDIMLAMPLSLLIS